jgi:hypothetical protein
LLFTPELERLLSSQSFLLNKANYVVVGTATRHHPLMPISS